MNYKFCTKNMILDENDNNNGNDNGNENDNNNENEIYKDELLSI